MKPNCIGSGDAWYTDPKMLLVVAGLLIGLGSGYWGRELLSQSEQAQQYARVQSQISDVKLSVSTARTDMLGMRMEINRETSAKLKETAECNRHEIDKINGKLDAIMADLTDIKVQLAHKQ